MIDVNYSCRVATTISAGDLQVLPPLPMRGIDDVLCSSSGSCRS